METSESDPKRRVLPLWMTAQGGPPLAKKPKKRKAVTPASMARRPARRTVYCMSEAELVDVALGVLLEGWQQEAAPGPPGLEEADKPELDPIRSASSSPGSRIGEEDDDDSDSDNDDTTTTTTTGKDAPPPGRSGRPPGAPGGAESPHEGSGEEDDALKYVREIFFR
ncbi:cell cycle regulator of non-homologous end joining isoform X2 [Sorex araneus]|nr:cell cycle regulator of non-homologous end joining isoform X2 [Sorex araneus]XP_054999737.1 cell cycle regulator of non-homologous end joining isoform X2 [Sorex araneus]XP_054999740.1 cell cycle regulator of non-homologous end joining isoform X2 [Sorex araneus]XP_054999742.1 cell cycle regulator of non-homologous end joining isoform X2 [Sorex araneus]XP_054999744.1 cell cycle regulator of non-homologous end joining isoform X2 [Sorex araneus]